MGERITGIPEDRAIRKMANFRFARVVLIVLMTQNINKCFAESSKALGCIIALKRVRINSKGYIREFQIPVEEPQPGLDQILIQNDAVALANADTVR